MKDNKETVWFVKSWRMGVRFSIENSKSLLLVQFKGLLCKEWLPFQIALIVLDDYQEWLGVLLPRRSLYTNYKNYGKV